MGEWKTMRVGDLAASGPNAMATGPFGSAISSRYFRTTGVPVIRGANLSTDSRVRLKDKEDLVFLDPIKAEEFRRSKVCQGDLVFTCWGTINQIGLIDSSSRYPEYVISNKQMKLTPNPQLVDARFLYYQFSSPAVQSEILEGSIGSSIPGFNLTRLKSIALNIPPLDEQHRIADELDAADDLITACERVIAKKQAIKHGLMQQLLTGRLGLPGFKGDWATVTYADLVRIERGEAFKAASAAPGPVPVIAAGRSPAAFTDRSNRTAPVVTISSSGASAGYIAYHTTPIFASDCSTISPNPRVDLAYIYYTLVLQQDRLYKAQAGGAQPHVHAKDVYPLSVAVPPSLDEQRAIAAVLRDVDAELTALKRRLAKAQAIKTGMMQELLTARTRLPVKEAVA